jgi:hypothetical protein
MTEGLVGYTAQLPSRDHIKKFAVLFTALFIFVLYTCINNTFAVWLWGFQFAFIKR